MELEKINRLEVIDENGRSYTKYFDAGKLTTSLQDGGKTLKMFIANQLQEVTVKGIKERGYPIIYNWAIENQSNQGNMANMYLCVKVGKVEGGFEWGDTPEGYEFWEFVSCGEFVQAMELINTK